MNKIKIICTIGPACSSPEILEKLVDEGMNIARLNFSHSNYEEHAAVIKHLKRIREDRGINLGILQDLSGPKIRVGELPDNHIVLEKGKTVRLVPGKDYSRSGEIHNIPVGYEYLLNDVQEGGRVLLDDGYIELEAQKKENDSIICLIKDGGILKSRKGVNFPGQILSGEIPTEKDIKDLKFGIEQNVDFVALSFVQTEKEIKRLREKISEFGGNASIIAKIERDTAIRELDSIISASDGIMVARGDLGIECRLSMIPVYQKLIVRLCNLKAKPVIIATQMLESMIKNPIPTRAEVTDVANAIYDGSDAIMLSAETAVGDFPIQVVKLMREIADNVEKNLWIDRGWLREEKPDINMNPELAIAESICSSASKLDAKFIIANTMSGKTAHLISMFRPKVNIIAMTPSKDTYYKLSIVWGLNAVFHPELNTDFIKIIEKDEQILKKRGLIKENDLIVISAGIPNAQPGKTNIMKLHKIE